MKLPRLRKGPTLNIAPELLKEIQQHVRETYGKRYVSYAENALADYEQYNAPKLIDIIIYLQQKDKKLYTDLIFIFGQKNIDNYWSLLTEDDINKIYDDNGKHIHKHPVIGFHKKSLIQQEMGAGIAYGHDELQALMAVTYAYIRKVADDKKNKETNTESALEKIKKLLADIPFLPKPALGITHATAEDLQMTLQ